MNKENIIIKEKRKVTRVIPFEVYERTTEAGDIEHCYILTGDYEALREVNADGFRFVGTTTMKAQAQLSDFINVSEMENAYELPDED